MPRIRSPDFSYNTYTEYVHSKHPQLFARATPADSDTHWLRAVLRVPQQQDLERTVFPHDFGVSLLGIMNDHFTILWSTSFTEYGNHIQALDCNESVLSTAAADLVQKIDELDATTNLQILVIHCFPSQHGPSGIMTGRLRSDSAFEALIDATGARLGLDPRFFIAHFNKSISRHQEPEWQPLPSQKNFVQLSDSGGGYITATSGCGNLSENQIAVVLDSSISESSSHYSKFMPTYNTSYMDATYFGLRHNASSRDNVYHLKPYTEQLLRTSLAVIKASHSCTDVWCRGVSSTWQEINVVTQLLSEDLTELQRYLGLEKETINLSSAAVALLSDFRTISALARSYEKNVRAQAQVIRADVAEEEAEETYKQAQSMQNLTTIAWRYIPLSFSASFFGMNVSQLNRSGPDIGYFFLLLCLSLLLSASIAILFTDWWRSKALAWRNWVEPGHSCAPRRPTSLPHLLHSTIRWFFRRMVWHMSSFIPKRFQKKDTENNHELSDA